MMSNRMGSANSSEKVLSYACSMGFGPTSLPRYHKYCKARSCQCDCHLTTMILCTPGCGCGWSRNNKCNCKCHKTKKKK
jgi:hypothetical protein